MSILTGIILLILFVILYFIIYLYSIVSEKIRILFGYKKYEYTKILSHGMLNKYKWCKTDEEALKHYTHFEFVTLIKPYYKRLKPL